MDDNTQEEKQYAKRFNQGYVLSKHDPELLKQLGKGNENSDYIKTMQQGAKQAEREKVRERLSSNKGQSNEADKGIDID